MLYIAYESEKEVCGAYMLCVLFKTHLLLAVPQSDTFRYHVVALINLHGSQIEKSDDGRGEWNAKTYGDQALKLSRPPMPYCILLVEVDLRTRTAAVRIRILRLLKGRRRSLDESHSSPGSEKLS